MRRAGDAVAAAKLWLIADAGARLPYLARGLYALVTVETTEVPRIASDEHWRLYVNPDWAASVEVESLARDLAHELWHLLLDHAGRARSVGVDRATGAAWHRATDLALFDTLSPEGVASADLIANAGALRAGHPGKLPPGRPAEEYWATLTRLPAGDPKPEPDEHPADEHGHGSSVDGLPRPWELPPEADVGLVDAGHAQGVREVVAIEYRGRKGGRGDTPGEAARWVRRMTEPTLPWEQLLAQAVRRGVGWTSGRTHTTWTRPNRRAASTPGLFLPGWRRPNPTVAMVVDTSGSVDDALLGRALGEVEGALRALGVAGSAVTVIACDAAVQAVTRVRRARDAVLHGGGGTDLRAAMAALKEVRPRPTLAVVLTDGWTPWPATPPAGCAVVVALLLRRGDEAPEVPDWATAIRCELDD
ncbi:hypothetical protein H5397_13755 [Propioniciclava sp. MC1683]|uniref:vWA domain-containing protein n=1 Tax=Propioniciclava sp. MC1683 TaxID=2760309 RepID=UPI0016014414|nr:VWA-like domain-containing protein [Propioniciclava sp. MC1683]MBB1502480.1 hypothetical protein [Propioniciclava sp. MC1683]